MIRSEIKRLFVEDVNGNAQVITDKMVNYLNDYDGNVYEVPPGYANYVYIDPSQPADGSDGDGSPTHPHKSWKLGSSTGTVLASNTAYLQKAGTVAEEVCINSYKKEHIYIGAYGTGKMPILKNDTTIGSTLYLQSSKDFIIENLSVVATNDKWCIYLEAGGDNVQDITIQNCKFYVKDNPKNTDKGGKYGHCIIASATRGLGKTFSNIIIQNNDFSGLNRTDKPSNMHCINISHTHPSPSNIFIRNNYFHNARMSGIVFLGRDEMAASEAANTQYPSPSGVQVVGNIFYKLLGSPLGTYTGLRNDGESVSLIKGNIFKDIGDWETGLVNAVQGQWLQGTEISYNYLDNIMTNRPDGAGIIIDWIDRRPRDNAGEILPGAEIKTDKISTGCKVHHNVCCNSRSREIINGIYGGGGTGIALFICKDCLAYSNYCYNNSVGISFGSGTGDAVLKAACTGNKVFNNTVCFNQSGIALSYANSPLIANNAILYNTWGIYSNQAESADNATIRYNYFGCNYAGDGVKKVANAILSAYSIEYNQNSVDNKTTAALGQDWGRRTPLLGQTFPQWRSHAWILDDDSPMIEEGDTLSTEYALIDTDTLGLNDEPVNSPPSIGCYQRKPQLN